MKEVKPKSGAKPSFLTQRLTTCHSDIRLEAIQRVTKRNRDQLMVRKVGLPPLFRILLSVVLAVTIAGVLFNLLRQ